MHQNYLIVSGHNLQLNSIGMIFLSFPHAVWEGVAINGEEELAKLCTVAH